MYKKEVDNRKQNIFQCPLNKERKKMEYLRWRKFPSNLSPTEASVDIR